MEGVRSSDFPDGGGVTYLDHAGATLYRKSQIDAVAAELKERMFGNPHSQGPVSSDTAMAVEGVRLAVLRFFNASPSDYAVVFTSGATAALKTVGEQFPWAPGRRFVALLQNHNSVVGIREYARAAGADASVMMEEEVEAALAVASAAAGGDDGEDESKAGGKEGEEEDGPVNLFAYPAECNASGAKFPLRWVSAIRKHGLPGSRGRWAVLLDAAKFVGSSPLDLSAVPADFVALSFYKMFGYPTGLGALLVRKQAASALQKVYFGGGTVLASSVDVAWHVLRPAISARLEDGSLSFLSIAALRHGLQLLTELRMEAVQEHTFTLIALLYSSMCDLRHYNGAPVCQVYGKHDACDPEAQGGVLMLNLLRADGSYVGYAEVEKVASLNNIQIRTGCFCNPGACQAYLGLSHERVKAHYDAGHVCWDENDVIDGQPTGAVRLSVGYMTTVSDMSTWLQFVKQYFVQSEPPRLPAALPPPPSLLDGAAIGEPRLSRLYVFPIKSCAGMRVSAWPMGPRGLLYDREWSVVDGNRQVLRMKAQPRLCHVRPVVDLRAQTLTITAPDMPVLRLPLSHMPSEEAAKSLRVCGDACDAATYGDRVADWFSTYLGIPCSLARIGDDSARPAKSHEGSPDVEGATIGFSNEAQYLLVSEESVADLNARMLEEKGDEAVVVDVTAFRANFIMSGAPAYAEDRFAELQLCGQRFLGTGPCGRCQMINIDPISGTAVPTKRSPLLALASYRRLRSHIIFGQFLAAVRPAAEGEESEVAAVPDGGELVWMREGELIALTATKDAPAFRPPRAKK
eukprot:PLAT8594.1.p1 GENE.PLAT8594.1~~PLAT8594.1.p1  ORF type:complete len:800 (-),score=345.06 PLAT8594.1:852-3251(-)